MSRVTVERLQDDKYLSTLFLLTSRVVAVNDAQFIYKFTVLQVPWHLLYDE